MQDFYVYIHRKATTGEVFYVGKGYGDRAHSRQGRTEFWRRVVAKHGYTVDIVMDNLQEWYAFELEVETILLYGRRDIGEGTLINMTDGGEGVSGRICSDDTRRKISLAHIGKIVSEETKKKMSSINTGKQLSLEHRQSIGAASKDRWSDDSYKEKVMKSKRHLMKSVVRSDGVIFDSVADASRIVSGSASHITEACRGKRKTAYGYTWRFYE